MKKLYILFIMFGLFFVPYVKTQAYTIDSLDEKVIVSRNLLDNGVQPLRIDGTTPNANDITFDPIEVIKDTAHTISFDKIGSTRRVRIAFYNNGTNVTSVGKYTIISSVNGSTDTTFGGVMFVEININNYSSVTLSFMGDFDEIKVNTLDTLGTLNSQLELGSTATSYEPYYEPLSLREVFEDGQLVVNPDFNDGSNGWTFSNYNGSVIDGVLIGEATAQYGGPRQNITTLVGNKHYINISWKATLTSIRAYHESISPSTTLHEGTGSFYTISYHNTTVVNATDEVRVLDWTTNFTQYSIDYYYIVDTTLLSIDHFTKSQMDYWFNEYQKMLAYNEGFTDTTTYQTGYNTGFEFGYNTGYTDAVQEDNAYSLGYALGLQEGQDMETGSSIIVLVLALMAFAMMLFGFISKRRIFNLFASGLFIALGAILFEYPAFIIVTIGLVIVNVYYTFVSD